MQKTNSNTKRLAIFGDPIEHTKSPIMHNYLSEKFNNNYIYTAIRVKADELGQAMASMKTSDLKGVNITAPHKISVMKYLDEISTDAERLGSVNTVVNKNGRLIGYNTDAEGFIKSLVYEGVEVSGKDILIFGAGGATGPIACILSMKGAKSITIKNRTVEKAIKIKEYIKTSLGYEISTEITLDKYDIIINTTSLGMYPDVDKCPIDDFSIIDQSTVVVDMIYNPSETKFLKNARLRGAKTVNGLGMLIFQGLLAYELFTDTKLPENAFMLLKKEVFNQ